MATRSRRLELLITGDASKAQKALRDLDSAAGRHGKGIEKAGSGIRDAMVGIGLAGVGMFALGEWEEGQKVAARTEAVIRSTGGAAGETADEIEALAEEISRKTATDDELVQSAANAVASLQELRNEAGEGRDIFDRSTKAAVDWAAATGGDAADAADKLGKILVNPEKALARLTKAGVVFTDEEKKKLAALQATGDEIGQQVILLDAIERKVGGSAEAMATSMDRAKLAAGNAAEALGGVLAPAIELVADVVEPLSGAFQSLDQNQQTVVAGLGVGLIAWQKWGGTAVETLLDVTGSSRSAEDAVAALNGVLAKGGLAAAAGLSAYHLTYKALEELTGTGRDVDALADSFANLADKGKGLDFMATAMGTSVSDLVSAFKTASRAPDSFGEGIDYLATSLDNFGGSKMRTALNEVDDFDDALATMVENGNADQARVMFDALSAALLEQGLTYTEIFDLLNDYNTALNGAAAANGYTETAVGALSDVLAEQETQTTRNRDAFKSYADKVEEARRRTVDFYRDQFGQTDATIEVEANLDSLTTSLAENGRTMDITTEAGRANRQALQDYVAAAAAASVGTDDAAGSMDAYRLRLIASMQQAGYTKDEINLMLAEMHLTPEEIQTRFSSNAGEERERVNSLNRELSKIPGTYVAIVDVQTQSDIDSRNLGSIMGGLSGFAAGGRPPAGVPYVVGEKGPEVRIDGPGTIVPNHAVGNLMGGGSPITVIVQGSVISERDLVDAVAEGLARKSRSQGSLGFGVPASSLVGVPGL